MNMLTKAQHDDLESFADAITVPLSNTDADKWPIRAGRVGKLCLDEFSKQFFADTELLEKQGKSTKEIAQLFHNPTHLWRMSHHLLNGLKMQQLSLETQQQSILLLVELVKELKYGDPFCKNGKNIIWSPIELKESLPKKITIVSNNKESRLIHALAGVLWSYTESLYFVAHELGVEIHGEYKLSHNRALIVRDFFDLHPQELWPSVKNLLSYKTIRILTVYKNFDARLDVYNNLYLNPTTSLVNELTQWAVLVDEKPVGIEKISEIMQEASIAIEAITNSISKMSLEEVAYQYVHLFWWRKLQLSKAVRKDWLPPKGVLNRIQVGKIPDPVSSNPSFDELRKQYNLNK